MNLDQLALDNESPYDYLFFNNIDSILGDFEKYISGMKAVKRYSDPQYVPSGCIEDNLYKHLLRGLSVISRIEASTNLKNIDFQELKRMFHLHDFHEIGQTVDINRIRKSDENTNEHEDYIDKLSKQDNALIKRFNTAASSLKSEKAINDPVAILCKIIDYIEGSCTFHFHYTKWLSMGNHYDGLVPPESVFKFARKQDLLFRNSIQSSDLNNSIKEVCFMLLNLRIKLVLKFWKEVKVTLIPQAMLEEITLMKNEFVN